MHTHETVYSLMICQGSGADAHDQEYVTQCARTGLPHNQGPHFCGTYNLDHVIYMPHRDTAERARDQLNPQAFIVTHRASADYVARGVIIAGACSCSEAA